MLFLTRNLSALSVFVVFVVAVRSAVRGPWPHCVDVAPSLPAPLPLLTHTCARARAAHTFSHMCIFERAHVACIPMHSLSPGPVALNVTLWVCGITWVATRPAIGVPLIGGGSVLLAGIEWCRRNAKNDSMHGYGRI